MTDSEIQIVVVGGEVHASSDASCPSRVTPDVAVYTEYKYWLTLDTGHRKLLSDSDPLPAQNNKLYTDFTADRLPNFTTATGFWVSDTTPINKQ